MAAGTGEVIVDFGTGTDVVTAAVARATVAAATTQIEAYLFPKATTDHSVDEHLVDPPRVHAHSIVDGAGFSISAVSPPSGRSALIGADYLRGKYTVRWVSTG